MKINYLKIMKNQPLVYKLLKTEGIGHTNSTRKLYNFFDDFRVRVFTGYGASGGYRVEVYRAMTFKEYKKLHSNLDPDPELNWKMKREGIIQSFNTRDEAEKKGFEVAFEELEFLLKEEENLHSK